MKKLHELNNSMTAASDAGDKAVLSRHTRTQYTIAKLEAYTHLSVQNGKSSLKVCCIYTMHDGTHQCCQGNCHNRTLAQVHRGLPRGQTCLTPQLFDITPSLPPTLHLYLLTLLVHKQNMSLFNWIAA